jgi:hypothetical protein
MIDRAASVRCIYTRLVFARGGVMSPWLCGSRGGCVSAGDEVVRKAREMKGSGGGLRVCEPASRWCGGDWRGNAGRRSRPPGTGRMRWGGRNASHARTRSIH